MQISSVFTRPTVSSRQTAKPNPSPPQTENKADVFQPAHTQTVRFGGAHEDKALSEAIDRRDEPAARDWIAKGADIDAITENGGTLLTRAVLQRKHSAIDLIHKLGADMNKPNRHKWSAMNLAVSKGDTPTIQKLHEHGADPYATNQNGQNAASMAAALGKLDSIEALHQLNVNFNAKDDWNNTPLAVAAFHNQLPTIKLLCLRGADVTQKMPNGMSLAEYAGHRQKYDSQKLIQELVKEKTLTDFIGKSASDTEKETLLDSIFNDKPLADFIIGISTGSANTDPSAGSDLMKQYVEAMLKGKYPANRGNKSANQLIVELLHNQAGIPIPVELDHEKLTLNEAMRHNQPYLFETILSELSPQEKDTVLNKTDRLGQTALHAIVKSAQKIHPGKTKQDYIRQAKELLDLGADPLILDNARKTALDYLEGSLSAQELDDILNHFKPDSLSCLDQLVNENTIYQAHKNGTRISLLSYPDIKLRRNNDTPGREVELEAGDTLEVNNKLYKITPDLRLFKVSDDAKFVRFLFPDGIHDFYYKQNKTPACGKLTQFHALLDDPRGLGTRSLLDRFTTNGEKIYIHFKDYHQEFSIKNDIDDNGNCKTKPGEAQGVTGPLATQLIERAYYRGFKWNDLEVEDDDDFDDKASIASLSSSNLKKDNLTGTSFGVELMGDNLWHPLTLRFTNEAGKQLSLAESKAQSPEYAKQIEEFLTQFQQNPSIFRGRATTRLDSRGSTPLEDSDRPRSLNHKHAHYFKRIELKTDNEQNTQRIFHIIDPHKVKRPFTLSERDFMNNIYKISGLTPKVGGYKPQDTSD